MAQGLFQRFRQQRNESSRPFRQQYSEFLRELASGQEVDFESLEICCSALGVDEAQLQADIETMQRRIQSQAAIHAADQAAGELRDVESQITRLRAEQDAYLQRTNAQLYELRNSELGLQGQLSSGNVARIWMRQNILDSELLERIADHHNRRQALLSDLHRAEENLSSRHDSRLNSVKSARVQVPYLRSLKKLDAGQQRQLREHEQALRDHSAYAEQMENELSAIKQQFRQLDVESEQLERQKLEA